MDLQLPIVIIDELAESVVKSTATLDLASGEIRGVAYVDYDFETLGLPAEDESYEFTSGMLSNAGSSASRDFRVRARSGAAAGPSAMLRATPIQPSPIP